MPGLERRRKGNTCTYIVRPVREGDIGRVRRHCDLCLQRLPLAGLVAAEAAAVAVLAEPAKTRHDHRPVVRRCAVSDMRIVQVDGPEQVAGALGVRAADRRGRCGRPARLSPRAVVPLAQPAIVPPWNSDAFRVKTDSEAKSRKRHYFTVVRTAATGLFPAGVPSEREIKEPRHRCQVRHIVGDRT